MNYILGFTGEKKNIQNTLKKINSQNPVERHQSIEDLRDFSKNTENHEVFFSFNIHDGD